MAETVEQENRRYLEHGLEQVFGREWYRLSTTHQDAIIRDCCDECDLAEFRRNVGPGNLEAYARVQVVRFALHGR